MSTNPNNSITIIDPPAVANLMDAGRFNQMMMIAQTMATASLIPDHLLGKKKGQTIEYFTADEIRANCFLIVNQSFRWGMDPFAVMPETYVVGGKLGYQGKLIAGVINALANLDGRLEYEFSGDPGSDNRTITVSGKFKGADKPVSISVSVGQAKTDNQMWRKDPDQKLVYTGATKWARRYCPEIVLGILTDDDADAIEIKPTSGRVVGGSNPYVENSPAIPDAQPASPESKPEKPAPRQAKAKPEPAAETPAEAAPVEVVTKNVAEPDHEQMIADIREACAERNVATPEATRRYRAAGVIPTGKKFADLTDAELYEVWKVRGIALDEQAPQEGGAK